MNFHLFKKLFYCLFCCCLCLKLIYYIPDFMTNNDKENTKEFHSASFTGRTELVRQMMDAGCDVHAKDDVSLFVHIIGIFLLSYILYAHSHVINVQTFHFSCIYIIYECNLSLKRGWTALHWAAYDPKGHNDVMRLLIDAGCDIHTKDNVIFKFTSVS